MRRWSFRQSWMGLLAAPVALCATVTFADVKVGDTIDRTLSFLETTQDRFGEFQSTLCDRANRCHVDSTPFITTFVLHSIKGVKDQRKDRMWSRGVKFLREEMLPGGLWRYWTFRAPSFVPILQPDLDDTVTASDILLAAGKLEVDNREVIRRNIDTRGRFLTWLLPETRGNLGFDFNPAAFLRNLNRPPPRFGNDANYWEQQYLWIRRNEFPNENDAAVNANVLLYLKEEIPVVCDYLNRAIATDEPSVYYLGAPALYYMYGRAYRNGIHCLEPSRKPIVERLLSLQKSNGSFGSVQKTVLSLNTLLDFEQSGPAIDQAIRYLLSTQRPDGSWEDEYFFKESAFCKECRFWRSSAMTSAWVIEALLKMPASRTRESVANR